MHLRSALTVIFLILLCRHGLAGTAGCSLAPQVRLIDSTGADIGGLSPHFRQWLEANGYGAYNFPRDDIAGGSYGGRWSADDPIAHQPVVFVHGNSDRAAGHDGTPTGWTSVIAYFLANGYSPAELYATTWGPADPAQAEEQVHSFDYVQRVRVFIEAVLAYTGAEKLDLIAHSMGVTLARKAIQGGELDGRNLGPALTGRIDTFVGIAGANRGLTACFWAAATADTCSADDGFYPGHLTFFGLTGVSDFLAGLNADRAYEGEYVYSIWSRSDQLIGFGDLVYGEYTSRIPGQDGEKVYGGYPYGHFCVRDLTAPVQLEMIRHHRVP